MTVTQNDPERPLHAEAPSADAERPLDSRVAIVGLGYVGLPLAVSLTEAGLDVIGIDANSARIRELSAGRSPIDDIDDARLKSAIASGLRVSEPVDAAVADSDVVIVCVPTPIDAAKVPDLGPVLAAAQQVASGLHRGQLVVLQSTTYPGTTVGPFRDVL